MTDSRKSIVRRWLAFGLVVLSPMAAALRRPLLLAALHLATVCAVGEAITINFTYTDVAPHPDDLDGSRLVAIAQAATQYYESLLLQPSGDTTFTFDLRWENMASGGGLFRPGSREVALNNRRDWYFDPNPLNHSEFDFGGTGDSGNDWVGHTLYRDLSTSEKSDWYAGSAPGALEVGFRGRAKKNTDADGLFDLYSTVLHEIGHALGLNRGANLNEYTFPSHLIGGSNVAVKAGDGDIGHLAAAPPLMSTTGTGRSIRRLPSATDLLAIAGRINATSGSEVLPDLDRVDFLGTQSKSWNNPLNWIGGRVPNGENDIFIRHGSSVTHGFPSPPITISGSTLTVSNGTVLNSSDALHVSSGTLHVKSGGGVSSVIGRIGDEPGDFGNAVITGPGSIWTNSSSLVVGQDGGGTMVVADSGFVVHPLSGIIGANPGSSGTVLVHGTNSTWWISSGDLRVGGSGTGFVGVLEGGLVNVGGKLSINASSTVELNGGTLRFDGYERAGTFNYRAGTIQLAGPRVVGTDAAINELFRTPSLLDDQFLFPDDTIGFEADWSTSGDGFTSQSLTTIAASDGSDPLTTQEAVAVSSSLLRFPTWLTIPSGKALVIEGAADFETDLRVSGGRFTAQSLVTIQRTGRINVLPNGVFEARGPVHLNGGALNLSGGRFHLGNNFHGDLVNDSGTLRPMVNPVSPPSRVLGDYTQGADATLEMVVASSLASQSDFLYVDGAAQLGGELSIQLAPEFVPGANDVFTLLNAGSLSGEFANVKDGQRLAVTDGAGSFIVHYGPNSAFQPNGLLLSGYALTAPSVLAGDFNGDGIVNAADYTVWRDGLGSIYSESHYDDWQQNFGGAQATFRRPILGNDDGSILRRAIAVPEPGMHWLLLGIMVWWRRGFHRRRAAA